MHIRPATTIDYPELRSLYLASRQAAFFWEDAAKMSMQDFDHDTRDEQILVAVAADDQPIGFISLYLPDNFIHCLFVAPTAQHQHVGGQLLTAGLQRLQLPARLKCVARNDSALAFYEAQGWQRESLNSDGEPYWNLVFKE
jgi:ribosomal protein S18 acetylase RimI-like enzyme